MTINSIEILVLLSVLGYRGSACHKRRSHSETWHLIHSDTTSTQGNASATKEALKQLLPLMAYPLIFFLLSLIPIAEKIYHSTSATPSYFLALFHSLATPSGGVFVSMALYIHVCVMKKDYSICYKKKTQIIPVNEDGAPVPSQARPSTTHFTIPLESTLDNAFITSKGGQP